MKIEEDDLVIDEVEQEETVENAEVSDEQEPETIQEEDEDEDRVVTIGDTEPEVSEETEEEAPETPGWVKTVRKVNRKQESEIKRLKKKLEELTTEKPEPVELGEEPTLASCQYDDTKYKQEILAYAERKRKVEEQETEKAKVKEQQNKIWQSRQEQYVEQRKKHSFKDFTEAEELVTDTFSTTQQGIIVQGAEDSALLVYALGKNPKKLEELSKISDPVEFAFKVAKLESQLKVTNKKAPSPEKRVSSGKAGGLSGNGDATLERLRKEAEKTGDNSKVVAYKRKLRKG